ncbi:hypothetical protein V5O48_015969, partial [Marasmius crinis-equi]
MKTGQEIFGEAHPDLLERTMSESNSSDLEQVLSELWAALSPNTREHWEEMAKKKNPIL